MKDSTCGEASYSGNLDTHAGQSTCQLLYTSLNIGGVLIPALSFSCVQAAALTSTLNK